MDKKVSMYLEGGQLVVECSDEDHVFTDEESKIVTDFINDNKMMMMCMGFENWSGLSERLTNKLWGDEQSGSNE